MDQLKQLHDEFAAETITFEDFDARKQDLLRRVTAGLAESEPAQPKPVEN